MIYSFTFIGEPVAQGRPRFSYKYGIYRAIDPPKSKTFKENLSFFLKKQMQKNKYRISEKK